MLDILQPRDETKYQIAITFKTERDNVAGDIPRREYQRLLKQFIKGERIGTYEMILDGHVSKFTFPLQEIDTITVVPIIEVDNDQSRPDNSD